jgi:hypothetical protein
MKMVIRMGPAVINWMSHHSCAHTDAPHIPNGLGGLWLDIFKSFGARGVAQVVEGLFSKHKALSSNSCQKKKKKVFAENPRW